MTEDWFDLERGPTTIEDVDGKVVMDLGLMRLLMSPDEAEEFGSIMIWHAALARLESPSE